MTLPARITCLMVVILVACHSATAESPAPQRTTAPLEASCVARVYRADELWRAGDADGDVILGVIAGVTTDEDGRVYVLDGQLSTIHVFAAHGEYRGTLSREGDGPGESRRPTDLTMLGPDRLAFTHPFPGRVITLELDGTPAGDIHYRPTLGSSSSYVALQMIHGTRDRLVLGGTYWETDGEKGKKATGGATEVLFIAHCDADGQELSRCLEQRREIDYSGEVIDELDYDRLWDRVALSRDGYLFVAPDRNRYLIEVLAPGGELQHTIDQDAGGLERSSEQLAAVRRDLQAQVRYDKSPPREIRVCSTEPCVTGLWPRPNGSLWVRTSQGDHQARTVGAIVLDAYDEKGQFQNQVLLDFPFDPAADTLHPLGPDRVLIVCGGRDAALDRKGNLIPNQSTELPTIVCYQTEEDAN